MNKCKGCPFQYIDYRGNWKCKHNYKVVNAYGCGEDLENLFVEPTNKQIMEKLNKIEFLITLTIPQQIMGSVNLYESAMKKNLRKD